MTLIDPNQLQNLRDLAAGDDSFLITIIEAFLPQLEKIPGALRRSLAENEPPAVAELAHSLKGSAANVGAEDVAKLCFDIERCARRGDLEPVPALIDELETTAAATRRAYEAERAQLT